MGGRPMGGMGRGGWGAPPPPPRRRGFGFRRRPYHYGCMGCAMSMLLGCGSLMALVILVLSLIL